MDLQKFIESTQGQVVLVICIVLIFGIILFMGRKDKFKASEVVGCAILTALAVALNMVVIFRMPQGGSVTLFSMLPIALAGYLYGSRKGILAGFSVGFITLMINPYVIHPVQMLLDYPIAFGALAIGGVLARNKKYSLALVYSIGLVSRYFVNVLSGIVFFGSYAPENFSAITWSLFYNITYMGVEGIITILILLIPIVDNTFIKIRKGI